MIPRPKQAVVLAAGLGTRLRPLTLARPKPLMPLWNVPLLERILRLLEEWGVERIAVNLHSLPEEIQAFLDRRDSRAEIRTSYEPEILGTAGALRPLRSFLGAEPFWVVNADIAARVAVEPLLQAFAAGHGLAARGWNRRRGRARSRPIGAGASPATGVRRPVCPAPLPSAACNWFRRAFSSFCRIVRSARWWRLTRTP